jgi:hypothetical protein
LILASAIFMRRALVAMVGPPRSATLALAEAIERVDRMLRRWSASGLALLVLAILPGARDAGGGLTEPAAARKPNSAELQRLSALVSARDMLQSATDIEGLDSAELPSPANGGQRHAR